MAAPSAPPSLRLDGRVALVTGAAAGIGQATAIALAASGAIVACTDVDPAGAIETAHLVTRSGGNARGLHLDVTDRDAVNATVDDLHRREGRFDILANVAGAVIARGPVATVTEPELDESLTLNLKSLVYACQAAARLMSQGGSIINVGSGTVDAAVAQLAAYSIPKAGVLQLTRSLARELGPAGIRVNTVSPGFIITDMTARHWQDDDGRIDLGRRQQLIDRESQSIPLGRPGNASEVASVITFLAGDGASYITGQTIRINGGSTMPL